MITAAEIESALRPVLPSQLYAQLPALARLLAALLNSEVSPAEAQSRLITNSAFAPLRGRTRSHHGQAARPAGSRPGHCTARRDDLLSDHCALFRR
jgi:hypothetical protein